MSRSRNAFQTLGLATADERHYFNRQLLAVARDLELGLQLGDYERNVEFWPEVERRTRIDLGGRELLGCLQQLRCSLCSLPGQSTRKSDQNGVQKKEGGGGNQKKDNDGDGGSGRGKDGNGLVGMGSGLKA